MTDLAQAAAWHRQAAAVAAAAARTGLRHDELTRVRERLLGQQGRFADIAALADTPMPSLVPSAAEVTTAAPALGDGSTGAVAAALRIASSTLDAADAALTTMAADPASAVPAGGRPEPGTGGHIQRATPPVGSAAGGAAVGQDAEALPVAVRNSVIYGLYALGVLGLEMPFLLFISESKLFSLAADLLVLPVFAWAAGWATIGWAYQPEPGHKAVNRTPRLGLAICLLADLFLCAGYFTLSG